MGDQQSEVQARCAGPRSRGIVQQVHGCRHPQPDGIFANAAVSMFTPLWRDHEADMNLQRPRAVPKVLTRIVLAAAVLSGLVALPHLLVSQNLSSAELLHPSPDSWPGYHGDYSGRRH